MCVTHLKQTFCQSPPDLRPQKGAKEEQGDFGPGNVCVIQESPFGELQTARTTVSPCAYHYGGGSGNEVQVSRHGLHFDRPGVPALTAHCGFGAERTQNVEPENGKKNTPIETQRECREQHGPDRLADPGTSLLAHQKNKKYMLKQAYLTAYPLSSSLILCFSN